MKKMFLILTLLLMDTQECFAEQPLFGDEFMKNCTQGAIDAQPVDEKRPAQATWLCHCMQSEMNKTISKADLINVSRGDTEAYDEAFGNAARKCASAQIKSGSQKKATSNEHIPEVIWLNEMSQRLADRLPDETFRTDLLKTVHYEAARAKIDPQLVLSVIEVASGFKKYAVSPNGEKGFMQVDPVWVQKIGTPDQNLFHLRVNIRYGCTILRHYIDVEKGDVGKALDRYDSNHTFQGFSRLVIDQLKTKWAYQTHKGTKPADDAGGPPQLNNKGSLTKAEISQLKAFAHPKPEGPDCDNNSVYYKDCLRAWNEGRPLGIINQLSK